jgi:carbamoyl-phosphate synthase large subunit
MNSKKAITVLVTGVGGGSVGRQIMKSLRLASHTYHIIGTDIVKESVGLQDADKAYLVPSAEKSRYISKILEICRKEKVGFIAPGTDKELFSITREKAIFLKHGITILANNHRLVKLCLDKGELFNYLKQHKIRIPEYQIINNVKDLKRTKFPVIIKPASGGGSKSIFVAESLQELKFFTEFLTSRKIKVIIQEYMWDYEEEYTVGVLRLDNGRIKRSIAMKRDLKGLSNKETYASKKSGKKIIISSGISQGTFSDYKEVRKACEKISDMLNSDGPINIQCRKTNDGIMPFEINPRFSGTTSLRSMVGFNEPDFMIRYLLHHEIPPIKRITTTYVARDLVEVPLNFTKKFH